MTFGAQQRLNKGIESRRTFIWMTYLWIRWRRCVIGVCQKEPMKRQPTRRCAISRWRHTTIQSIHRPRLFDIFDSCHVHVLESRLQMKRIPRIVDVKEQWHPESFSEILLTFYNIFLVCIHSFIRSVDGGM